MDCERTLTASPDDALPGRPREHAGRTRVFPAAAL